MQQFETRELVCLENEGQKIYGMLHLPLKPKLVPAVVMCHGLAGNKIGKYRIYVLLAQQLAKEGIATLRFDFRGSGESEGDFSDMTVESEVSDALKALEFLKTNSRIDPYRIGMLGNSFGGPIAVLAAQEYKHIKSMVLLAALFHSKPWLELWKSLSTSNVEERNKEISRIMDGNILGSKFYQSFFQLNIEQSLASLNDVPMLHIYSEKDERIQKEQSDHYKRCRQNATAKTNWISLTKCDHDFSNTEERTLLIDETVKWFKSTLANA